MVLYNIVHELIINTILKKNKQDHMSVVNIGYAECGKTLSFIIVPNNIHYDRIVWTNKNGNIVRSYSTLTSILETKIFVNCITNTIVVDKLYMLDNVRNLDLYEFMKLINGVLVTSNGRVLLPQINVDSSGKLQSRNEYYEKHYANIYYIMTSYPGLIRYIHIDYYRMILSFILVGVYQMLGYFYWMDSRTRVNSFDLLLEV